MTSTAQAESPLPGVRGLVFLGFPLHPPKRPGRTRAEHLERVALAMLFLQGTRDDLAELGLIREVTVGLGPRATLHVVEGGNHSFDMLKRSGRTGRDVLGELAGSTARWLRGVTPATG
jgi:predicted alpha/beta-hydrolase family hydrolase